VTTPLQLPADPPAPIRWALEVRNARACDVARVRQEMLAARTALEAAVVEDRAAYVAARDRGKPDPGQRAGSKTAGSLILSAARRGGAPARQGRGRPSRRHGRARRRMGSEHGVDLGEGGFPVGPCA
jgi:hypothetical protein